MKINLAVLFGGKSVEHEISIISALQAIGNFDKEKYEVIPIYITKNNEFFFGSELGDIEEYRDIPALLKKCTQVSFVTKRSKTFIVPFLKKLAHRRKHLFLVDVAFPIVHGTNAEDGVLQGYLKMLDLPFVGCDVLSSAVCMDKFSTRVLLKYAGFPVLDCLRFTLEDNKDHDKIMKIVEKEFDYPVVIKPVNLGSSVGIGIVKNASEFEDSISTAFSFSDKIIVEPAIVNLREINCSVIGDLEDAVASECEEPYANDEILSYSDKYLRGSKQNGSKGMANLKRKIPADISSETKSEIQRTAIDAFKFLDCNGVSRIDFLLDSKTNEFWINEINTIPGSLSFYLWEHTGINYKDLLDKLVTLALKRQRKDDNIVYSFDTNILSISESFGSKRSKGSVL